MKNKMLKVLALTLTLTVGMPMTVFAGPQNNDGGIVIGVPDRPGQGLISEGGNTGSTSELIETHIHVQGGEDTGSSESVHPGRNSGEVISSLGSEVSSMTYEEIVQAVLDANLTEKTEEPAENPEITTVIEAIQEAPIEPAENPEITAVIEEIQEASVSAGQKAEVGGKAVVSSVAGMILAKSVPGVAIVTPVEELAANLSLSENQTVFMKVYDTDQKKSNLAMASARNAIEELGGKMISSLQVNLGAKENGKLVELESGEAGMVVGLPRNADREKSYYVIQVLPGGEVNVLADQDDDPATVSFPVRAGLGTYVLVAQ